MNETSRSLRASLVEYRRSGNIPITDTGRGAFVMAGDHLTQVMMTLSGLAGTAAAVQPSGETLAAQQARIFSGIHAQLADPRT
jgi:hypothetical protein